MKWLIKKLTLLLVIASFNVSSIGLWQTIEQKTSMEADFDIHPNKFHLSEFNVDHFLSLMAGNKQYSFNINLPMPNGNLIEFEIYQVNIMADELAIKFPDIHTFRGRSVNRLNSLVLDVSHQGLHAVIRSVDSVVWIDPINRQDNINHISYYQSELSPNSKKWQCGVNDDDQQAAVTTLLGSTLPFNELTLKTYRLAIAATAEYTSFHSSPDIANVDDGMAAIVTAMNRVNGIYETELGIRMILVANNDQLVFTDSTTDGYNNNNGFTMLGQNQTIIDNIIGSANYDIGHVFSTGGGGVANLGVPCSAQKARGVTGLNSPVNDVFYVDYVAHEMGHQWNANHVFNSVSNFCNGNRVSSAAVEPGSGSTILGYAGLCGVDDLQNRSDAYFNSHSLQEIMNYVNNFTNDCVVNIDTNNLAPVVEAGNNHSIPKDTPFTLCAIASDVDSTNITYNWEQHDLGPAGSPNTPSGNVPLFRSFNASQENCRTFPQISNILTQTQTLGEILPNYARDMNFRVTVRDNEIIGGALATDDRQLTVVDSGPFIITSHNTLEVFAGGQNITVNWDVANTDLDPVNCAQLNVSFSINGGFSFANPIAQINNTGSADITVPFFHTNQARIKLSCVNNVFFDINDVNLTIQLDDLIFKNGFE